MSKVNLRLINWRLFNATLKVDLGMAENYDELRLEDKIEVLSGILRRAELESAPIPRRSCVTPHWWDKELDKLRDEKMRSKQKLQRSRKKHGTEHEITAGLQKEFSRHCTRCVNAIRFYKKRSWLNWVHISSQEDPWVWHIRSW